MENYINEFLKTFAWYRTLSLNLLDQFTEENLSSKISDRSMPLREQFIDLGITQLKILEMITGKELLNQIQKPDDNSEKAAIKEYLLKCDQLFKDEIVKVENPEAITVSWFGRMQFNFKEILTFLQAHEAMHHGEVLSCVFANDIPMPEAFKQTWGFEL